MSGSVVLTLIAVVLSSGEGSVTVGGEALELLRPGDRGEIFYELTVGSENRRIDVGTAEVLSVTQGQAVLRPSLQAGRVQAGYAVELTVPYDRRGAATAEATERLQVELDTAWDRLAGLEAELAKARDLTGRLESELASARGRASELETDAQGIEAELRRSLQELEQRNADLAKEVEALVFVLGKTIAESGK